MRRGTGAAALVEPGFAAPLLSGEGKAHWEATRAALDLAVADVPATADVEGNYAMFRRLQAYEAWALRGDFVSDPQNRVSPGIAERFRFGEKLSCTDAAADTAKRTALREALAGFLAGGRMLVFPTMPGAAPLAADTDDQLLVYRERALCLLCVSGLTGFPQMSVPAGKVEGAPFGLSVLGPAGSDRAVIDTAIRLHGRLKEKGIA